jgi:hypothetical protein
MQDNGLAGKDRLPVVSQGPSGYIVVGIDMPEQSEEDRTKIQYCSSAASTWLSSPSLPRDALARCVWQLNNDG